MRSWIWPRETRAMSKLLIRFSLLWSFLLFLAPVPTLGNFDSGDCTVDDSPGKTQCVHVLVSNPRFCLAASQKLLDKIWNGKAGFHHGLSMVEPSLSIPDFGYYRHVNCQTIGCTSVMCSTIRKAYST